MGKISKKLREADVGSIGIGAMIIFIAMVLVAGIAASVLVQTANRLEITAMQTGQHTTSEVSSGLHVVDIEGHIKTNDDIDYIAIMVAPRAGSDDIDLDETYVEISDSSRKHILKYTSQGFKNQSEIDGSVFTAGFFTVLNATEFGILVIQDADGSCTWNNPVLNRGDKVLLTVYCAAAACFAGEVAERVDIWGMVQAEDGSPGVFAFRTPASYIDTVYDLY